MLTALQKKNRLAWARKRLNWTHEEWSSVLFSDESKFDVCIGDDRGRVIRNKSEAFHPDCLKRTVKFAKGVMVWGCMSARGVGNLYFIEGTVNAVKYQDILENQLLPSVDRLYPEGDVLFQQDGASCHTAKTTKRWLQDHHINVLDWTSSSPDLSPIENLWGIMKKKLRQSRPRTEALLKKKISEIWNSITAEQCEELVATMNKRLRAVIAAKGDATQF